MLYNASALVKQECNESRDVFWQRAQPLPGSWHLKDNRFHVAVMHRCNAIKELISDQEIQARLKNGSCHTCIGKSAKLANGGRFLQSGKNKVVPVTQNRLPVSVSPEGLVRFYFLFFWYFVIERDSSLKIEFTFPLLPICCSPLRWWRHCWDFLIHSSFPEGKNSTQCQV